MANYGHVDIQSAVVPANLQEVFPQMGDVWDENGPVEGVQGLALENPLSEVEIAALETAKASGEIRGYTYISPEKGGEN